MLYQDLAAKQSPVTQDFTAESLQQPDGLSDVGLLTLTILRDFTFDGQWAIVAKGVQRLEVISDANVTISQRNLGSVGWVYDQAFIMAVNHIGDE